MGPGWQETTTPLWLGSLHSPCAGLIFTPGATWQAGKVLGSAPGSPLRGRPTLVRPCGFGCPVAEEPRLAALDNLETRVLRGLRQVLGLSSQECVEVLQLRDLDELQVGEGPHGVVRTVCG